MQRYRIYPSKILRLSDSAHVSGSPACTPSLRRVSLWGWIVFIILQLRWQCCINDGTINVVAQNVALYVPSSDHAISTDEASKLLISGPAHHLVQTQVQKHLRLSPKAVPEAAYSGLIYSEGPPNPCSRPVLFQAPEYEALLIRAQPCVVILRASRREIIPEPFIKRQSSHDASLYTTLGLFEVVAELLLIAYELYVDNMLMTNRWYGIPS